MSVNNKKVVVVGAGIAGLTTAAILTKVGLSVTLLESHTQPGGCAGTFKRKGYVFDVGATQVAGLEQGGIHSRIFEFLGIHAPEATILNPACIVDLSDGSEPIKIWFEREKWITEREEQFPGSGNFWKICSLVHQSNWNFANNNPVLPFRTPWDVSQFFKALMPQNLLTSLLLKSSMFDLLKICGSDKDTRLINFLNLQLKLYSQENVYNTAALYGCTVLQISQSPHGLWHLKGSMQTLSSTLVKSIKNHNGRVLYGEKVNSINFDDQKKIWRISTLKNNKELEYSADDVIFTPPPEGLLKLFKENSYKYKNYRNRIKSLPQASGALVFYSAIRQENIKEIKCNHYQFIDKNLGSLFLSFSDNGDGRAPEGEITLIASMFVKTKDWTNLSQDQYALKKKEFFMAISNTLENKFQISPSDWLHRELSTPVSFERWTQRPQGIVGGLGQHPDIFGLFGLSSRTPFKGLWLCGDSIYPGEGTAGVSQSALMVSRQILASKGIYDFDLTD